MQEKQQFIPEPYGVRQLAKGLSSVLAPSLELTEALEQLVQEAFTAVNCDHLFLSRYDASSQFFRTVAWRSPIHPGDVPVDQKFMGNSYCNGQPIIAHDLSQYNYRMRPAVARMGLKSMIGIPVMTSQGMAGVLEAFSQQTGHFADQEKEVLSLFATQAAALLEKADAARNYQYMCAENDFLLEALKLEQASVESLFYKVGETFSSVLGMDGVAVFGLSQQEGETPLQEVMTKGFSLADIARLKALYNRETLQRMATPAEGGQEPPIVKQSFKRGESGGTKLLYLVPVVYKRTLFGVIFFYWKEAERAFDMPGIEKFIRRMIGHITMVLSRKEIYANIQKISFYDILTGLANRRLMDYILDRELKKVKRSMKPVSMLMVDIDQFKTLNDLYGHLIGDSILEQIGLIIKETFRSTDLPARYGGEEFAVILPETDREDALALAERLREKVAACQFNAGNRFVSVTISIGGATYNAASGGDSNTERLILAADKALYQAKQLGRNITVFTGNV